METELPVPYACEVAALTHPGTERPHNEDACIAVREDDGSALVIVADGISGQPGGEVASETAVETTLQVYRDQPAKLHHAKRLYRAAQQANIRIFDRSVVVPELRNMGSTLTAFLLHCDQLFAVHVGDSRLYLIRAGQITQLTKDHTVVGERVRYGLLSKERARCHPDRSTLTRSLGRDLIVAVDQLATRVMQHDVLVSCTDGLYNVLEDSEIEGIVGDRDVSAATRALIEHANARGTPDNLSVAMLRVIGPTPAQQGMRWTRSLRRWFAHRPPHGSRLEQSK